MSAMPSSSESSSKPTVILVTAPAVTCGVIDQPLIISRPALEIVPIASWPLVPLFVILIIPVVEALAIGVTVTV